MQAVYLPGGSRTEVRDVPIPEPGHGEVLVRMRASTICGSDLRAIYHEHRGSGAERYRNVIAGHEPSGEIAKVGPGCVRLRERDRVAVYHIAGCGSCAECRSGYMIGCTSSARAAYGWQRDGGHAEYMLATETTCILLPDSLSFLDGACAACGTGTAYEALCRAEISGRDRLLVTGLGPVGLSAGMLAKKMGATLVVGVDVAEDRRALALSLGAVDEAVSPEDASAVAERIGGFESAVDCSGSTAARSLAVAAIRTWGRVVLVGEGNRLELDASPALIHKQATLRGSWVTSLQRMEELLERLARWDLHPDRTVTDTFPLAEADTAYKVAAEGRGGKVAIVFE